MVFLACTVMMGTSLQLMAGSGTMNYLGKTSQANFSAQDVATTGMSTVISYVQTQLNNNAAVNLSYFSSPTTVTMPLDPTALGGSTVTIGTYTAAITARGNSYLIRVTGTVNGADVTVTNVVNMARNTYLLDSMTNANVAFALRKLRSAYSGSAIRVRRAIDNAQQDIGFLPNGDLDLYSLYDFLLVTANDTNHSRMPIDAISPSVTVAFGLRRLQEDYTGALIQVRRSSDSSTLDIGCDASGDLDLNALLAFVGTGTAYVTIWYDQSGNSTHATQATSTLQPTIVTNGVLNMVNNRPAILYDGVDDTMLFNRTISDDFSILACFNVIAGWNLPILGWFNHGGLIDMDVLGIQNDFGISVDTSGGIYAGIGNPDTSSSLASPGYNDSRMHWLGFTRAKSTGQFNLYHDTASYREVSPNTGSLTAASQIAIGKKQTGSNPANVYISEVLVYNSVLSDANRLIVAQNEAFYYNMAVPPSVAVIPSLDLVGGPTVACGLRKLRGFYGSSAIRVRSSAGGSQDIGFTTAGDLDISTLMSFVGNNSGYVSICYDQSGNNRNLTQGTAANQPRIVNAGVLDMINNRPAMYFNGSSYLTYTTGASFLFSPFASGVAMFNVPAASPPATDYSRVLSAYKTGSSDWNSTNSAAFLEASAGSNLRMERISGITTPFNYGSPLVGVSVFDGLNAYLYINGAQGATMSSTGNFDMNTIRLGSSDGLGANEFLVGYLGEAYLYPFTLSSLSRQTIEKNILQYFSASLSAGYVTIWYDQSGNGYNAIQPTPYLQPTIDIARYASGMSRPTITFNGKQKLVTTGGMPTSADYSKNAVFSYYSNTDYNNIISSNGGHGLYNAGSDYLRMWHTGDFAMSNTPTTVNTYYSINASFTQATMTGSLYQGNVLVGSGVSPSSAVNSDIYLGAWGTQSYLNGSISEALVFNRVLSTLDRTTIYKDQCGYFDAQ